LKNEGRIKALGHTKAEKIHDLAIDTIGNAGRITQTEGKPYQIEYRSIQKKKNRSGNYWGIM
jgi:hypothetical protein